ncbi:MAG TPA: Hpt domain-containing protein [Allosphingosinicella sp.]|jgi:HPt (histidine-containing phosphotransfer) domain-containing protein
MVFDPGALNASLAAAVGSDRELMAELKLAFTDSVARQLDLLGRSRCDANWELAAARLKSIAASFGANGLIALAEEALAGAPGDPVVQRKIASALADFGEVSH